MPLRLTLKSFAQVASPQLLSPSPLLSLGAPFDMYLTNLLEQHRLDSEPTPAFAIVPTPRRDIMDSRRIFASLSNRESSPLPLRLGEISRGRVVAIDPTPWNTLELRACPPAVTGAGDEPPPGFYLP